jgi:CRISPR system Cascade subunit CasB
MTAFVEYLQRLPEGERGHQALAALRRGLGRPPGEALEMHRYVADFLPEPKDRWDWSKQVYYLIASLFGLHPQIASEGNMGAHFARLCEGSSDPSPAVERRLNSLLASHPDDLYRTLQHAVSLLKSKDVPINWERLFRDLQRWDDSDSRREVQRRWAMSFWSAFAPRKATSQSTSEERRL